MGVVVMVIAYTAGTWSYWCKTTECVRAGIDERLHPKYWRLGDVHLRREGTGRPRLEVYRASMGDIDMSLVTAKGEDGEVYRTGHVIKDHDTYMGVLPAEEVLREELPELLTEAADAAQLVAQEMRQHKPWPWSLRSIGRRVRDVAERRMRVEASTEPGRGLYCSEILYGSEKAFSINTFGEWARLTVWDGRAVARVKDSVLDFGSAGNIAYADETADVALLQTRVINAIDSAVEALQAAPSKPADAIKKLGEARTLFESQDYARKPELDRAGRDQLMSPWDASIVHTSSKGASNDEPEEALVRSATVAGVEISKDGCASLKLAKDDVSVTWRFMGGRSKLTVERGGYEALTMIVTEDTEYPSVTARFEGEEQEVLDEVRAMARDMLSVPLEEWPAIVWREELLSTLRGVDEGRYCARGGLNGYHVGARVMAEGNELEFSVSQTTFIRFDCTGSLDVLLDAGGIKAFDQRSGSLLVADGDSVRLTQRRTDETAGKAFDAATFAALAGMLREYKSEVPEELRQSLDVLVAFATDPQIPQPILVDTLEAPDWSAEHRQERTKALSPSR